MKGVVLTSFPISGLNNLQRDKMSVDVDKLWAPWRGEWILSQKDEAKTAEKLCPFCEVPKDKPSYENLVLFKNDSIFVIMNKFPYNPGHVMIIPRSHCGSPTDLPMAVWKELNVAIHLTMSCVKEVMTPLGFNLGMNVGKIGGAGIPDHLHWHILPRWGGDTNFMPLLAEAKALPFHNKTVYEKLAPAFEGFAEKLSKAMIDA